MKSISSTPVMASKPAAMPAYKAPATPTSTKKFVGIFIVGAIVGGVLTWGWYTLQKPAVVTQNPTNTGLNTNTNVATPGSAGTIGGSTGTTPTTPVVVVSVGSSDSLSVPALQDAGLTVAITAAPVTQPTWVVVYETTASGERGNALGAGFFLPTTGSRNINLLRATETGKTYLVGKRVDNGDKDFSMTLDQPVLNAAGKPLYVEFKAR
jgi:hypothetical protein